MLGGANAAALRSPAGGDWEVVQFQGAELVAPREYRLSGVLRGQAGTDAVDARAVWPAGTDFVLLDGLAGRSSLPSASRGVARHYRVGPAVRPYDDPSYRPSGRGVRGGRAAALSAGTPGRARAGGRRNRAGLDPADADRRRQLARRPTSRWAKRPRATQCGPHREGACFARSPPEPRASSTRWPIRSATARPRRSYSRSRRYRSASGRTLREDRIRWLGPPSWTCRCVMPSQAQKHVTVNEALARLDAVAQLRVLSSTVATPPDTAGDGRGLPRSGRRRRRPGQGRAGRSRSGANGGWTFLRPAGRVARHGTRAAPGTGCSTGPTGSPTPSLSRRAEPRSRGGSSSSIIR